MPEAASPDELIDQVRAALLKRFAAPMHLGLDDADLDTDHGGAERVQEWAEYLAQWGAEEAAGILASHARCRHHDGTCSQVVDDNERLGEQLAEVRRELLALLDTHFYRQFDSNERPAGWRVELTDMEMERLTRLGKGEGDE